jgi:hypothetical protein
MSDSEEWDRHIDCLLDSKAHDIRLNRGEESCLWAEHEIKVLRAKVEELEKPYRNVELTCPWCNKSFVTAAPGEIDE